MFAIHSASMALATQLFGWLHPVAHSNAGAAGFGANALLLAFVLIVSLLVRGAMLLDDSFSAALPSVHAALETLAGLPARRRIAVLGPPAAIGVPLA